MLTQIQEQCFHVPDIIQTQYWIIGFSKEKIGRFLHFVLKHNFDFQSFINQIIPYEK